jgi:chemotaxis protein MotA
VDIATIVGLVLGFGAIFGGMIMEGGSPAALISPSSALIVIVGTIAVGFVAYPLQRMLGMVGVLKNAFLERVHDPRALADELVAMAEQSRREGLLSLESKAQETHDPFVKKGLMLMIDGTDPERLRSILEIEIAAREERHEGGVAVLESMGGFAPTLGIMGTVLGLVNVLSNLTDTSTLGEKIAGAFIATFYGVFTANIIFLPLGNKLKTKMKLEAHVAEMALTGLLAIQAGDNPRIVREKLEGFLAPKRRSSGESPAAEERVPAAEPAAA